MNVSEKHKRSHIDRAKRGLAILLLCISVMVGSIPVAAAVPTVTKYKGTKVMSLKYPTIVSTRSSQDCYVEKGVLFKFWNKNVVQLYDFRTGKLTTEKKVTGGHCSAATSDRVVRTNSKYGDMYIEMNTNPAILAQNRLTTSGKVKLVRKWKFPASGYGYGMKHAVDGTNKLIYSVGTKLSNRRQASGNSIIVAVWSMKNAKKNADGTYTPRLIKTFSVKYMNFIQGVCFRDGKIYVLSSDYINPNTKVYAIDPARKSIVKIYSGFRKEITKKECEGLFFYGNHMYIDNKLAIYRIY